MCCHWFYCWVAVLTPLIWGDHQPYMNVYLTVSGLCWLINKQPATQAWSLVFFVEAVSHIRIKTLKQELGKKGVMIWDSWSQTRIYKVPNPSPKKGSKSLVLNLASNQHLTHHSKYNSALSLLNMIDIFFLALVILSMSFALMNSSVAMECIPKENS